MTESVTHPTFTARRVAAGFAGLALGMAVLSGCDSQGADTDCSINACTVTFDRSAEAKASILGVEAKVVNVDGDKVTVEVAGEQATLTVGQAGTDVGGFQASLQSVTDSQVVVKIARPAG